VQLVENPQYSVHFDVVHRRKCAKTIITGKQDAIGLTFCKREGKAVMYRKARQFADNGLCAKHPFARQVNDLQAAADESLLLSGSEL